MQQNLKDCRIRATSIARATTEPLPLVAIYCVNFWTNFFGLLPTFGKDAGPNVPRAYLPESNLPTSLYKIFVLLAAEICKTKFTMKKSLAAINTGIYPRYIF